MANMRRRRLKNKSSGKTKIIAIYGTLRVGLYNYYNFGLDKCRLLAKDIEVKGYIMLVPVGLGYPITIKGDGKIIVDVFEVPENTFKRIDKLEMAYGYTKEKIELNINGKTVKATIWIGGYTIVEHGDFKRYLKERYPYLYDDEDKDEGLDS